MTADPAPEGWTLEVTRGPNAGARVALAPGRWRLGSGAGSDILLADPAAAEAQAVLEIAPAGRAALTALAPGLSADGRAVPAGKAALRLPPRGAELALGASSLRLVAPAVPRGPAWPRACLLACCAAAALGATSLVATALPRAPSHARPAGRPPAGEARADAAAAAAGLEARLAELGIAEGIKVSAADGAVSAVGRVAPGDMARWREAQAWFDATEGGAVALLARVAPRAAAEEAPRFALRAVSGGAVPYVILGNGDKYGEGAVLEGGWVLESITVERLVLARGGRRVEVGF